jgi:hypothetical protein
MNAAAVARKARRTRRYCSGRRSYRRRSGLPAEQHEVNAAAVARKAPEQDAITADAGATGEDRGCRPRSNIFRPSSRPAQEQAEVVAGQRVDQLKQRDFITLLGGRGVHLVLLPSAWRAFTTFYYFAPG